MECRPMDTVVSTAIRELERFIETVDDAMALPPAFKQENLKHLGPAQCSECGSPWPVVPPPAADIVQQPHGKDLLSH